MDTTGAEVKDSIEAATEEEAQQTIRQMGYFVTKLTADGRRQGQGKGKKKKAGARSRKTFAIGGVIGEAARAPSPASSRRCRTPACRSCAACASSNSQMKPGVLKNALIDVVDDIESGTTLSEAFGKHPKCFDRLYVNMIKAGEAGGALEVILQRLADFKEKAQTLKRKINGAMIYPFVVIIVAVGILTFIMIRIIPKFEKIFDDFEHEAAVGRRRCSSPSRRGSPTTGTSLPLFPLGIWLLIKLIRLNKTGTYALDRMHAVDPDRRQTRSKRPSSPAPRARWARWSPPACRSSKR